VKLGIGARITAVFGLGALILSIFMGGLSYFTVRHFLLAGRESAAQHQTFTNANLVRNSIQQGSTGYVGLLGNLDAGTDAHSVLFYGSKTYDTSLAVTAASIPHELRSVVVAGTAATQTYRTPQGTAEIVVGVPIPSVKAEYFDVFDLSDLDHTLRVLALALIVAGGVTTLLGIGLGRFASTRSLRPLAVVSRAARAIAGGDLDTRLDAEAADPDLEGFTLSFNAMVDQLQERIEREARFNSDVSHELRSPLTTLSASVEVLEGDRANLSVRSQRALQLLSDDLRRFQRMVADLLEMSRADAGSVDVFLEDVHVAELVPRAVEAAFAHMDAHRNVTPPEVHVDPAVESLRIGVDKRRFERVMVNLLENADHYGGGATTVGAGVGSQDATKVEVTVDDAGPGINPLERTKVFDRFYRGSESGRRGTGTGTGLGLALVAEHMRAMHGAVRVESSPEGGARFVLTLPALAEDVDEDEIGNMDGDGLGSGDRNGHGHGDSESAR
jgi:two-component system, OmpR family, sensor histidine kinase MtrB